MIQKILKWLPASLMLAFFLITLVMVLSGFGRIKQVLFFPLDNGKGYNAEQRMIPANHQMEKRIQRTVEELLLGPSVLEFEHIVPKGTKLQSLLVKEKVVYLDFSHDFFNENTGLIMPFQERVDYLKKNVLFNFPSLNEAVITIDGQQPLSPYYQIEQSFNNGNR